MNIVYWIHIHESIDEIWLPHTVKYFLFNEKKTEWNYTLHVDIPAAYSYYLLKEIKLN